jgi:hypothetical protein
MPAVVLSKQDSIAALINDLATNLEEADPTAKESAEKEWAIWSQVEVERAREPRQADRAYLLATAHLPRCRQRREAKCVPCAIAKAILLCCMVEDDKHALDFALAVGAEVRNLLAIRMRLIIALAKYQKAEKHITRMRRDLLLPTELRRRAIPLRVRLAARLSHKLLQEVPRILLPEEMYRAMRPSLFAKPGVQADAVVDFIARFLKNETGRGDKRVADLMGLTKEDVRRRRRRARTAKRRPKPRG